MRHACRYAALVAFGLASILSAVAAEDDPAPAWDERAIGDIESAYAELQQNHPGMLSPFNPGFRSELDAARQRGLRLASRATSQEGFRFALLGFSAALRDGHAGIRVPKSEVNSAVDLWPGFVAAWRGSRLLVHSSEEPDLSPGDRIVSCDGAPVEALVARNVYTFEGRPDEAGSWWAHAGRVFRYEGNPHIERPERCTVLSGAVERSKELDWRHVPEDYAHRVAASTDGERVPVGLTEPRPGLFWVGLQTFNPDAAEIVDYDRLFADLERRNDDLAGARAIVLDMRFNNGGASPWSIEIASRLWGRRAVDDALAQLNANAEIWWRASPDNAVYVTRLVDFVRERFDADIAAEFERAAAGITAAARHGESFFVQTDLAVDTTDADTAAAVSAVGAPVFVITRGACASACLDAIDLFTRFPNTRLVGAPTSADSVYMEVRSVPLPSGLARVVIPIKMWIGRQRDDGEIYRPDILMRSLDWSTEAFIETIESNLSSAR